MNPTRNPIRDVIRRRGALVIDGAMSTALEKLGMVLNDSLWSARALVANEDLVRQVHLDYFRAGANAAITDSYQATEAGFAARGFSCSDARRFIRRSAELAGEARDLILAENRSLAREDLLVAGAVGPYGAFLADGWNTPAGTRSAATSTRAFTACASTRSSRAARTCSPSRRSRALTR